MSSKLPSETIKEFEQVLRILIKDELSSRCEDWWHSMIPTEIRDRAESRKQRQDRRFPSRKKHNVIEYIDFSNYIPIMDYEQNWSSTFGLIFRDKNSLILMFENLNFIRNDISHSRDLTTNDENTLLLFNESIRAAIEDYKEKQQIDENTLQLSDRKIINIIDDHNKKHNIDEQTNLDFEEFASHQLTLNISSDKPIYPVGAFVHIRATLPHVLAGEPIIFQLFNVRQELCLEKYLDPETYDSGSLKFGGVYSMTFHPSEFESRVGDVLYAKAKHGKAIATDEWSIEQRKPIIRTDKPVYVPNSDMIVTVIDSDADKNSQQVEFIGDRKDSKLIIESKYGRIDGYKLRETGKSTGIFQGILEVLGVRKDGTVIEREVDGKIIDKTQGTGLEDGFIAARLGEEIKLSYKNKFNQTSTVVYVSNFGAIIEMDKKTYRPNDIVHITIVAPDLSFNSDVIDEIGNDLESKLWIQTKNDEIINYKLIETASDTGIFTGQIQLSTELNNLPKMLGPNDGKINCNSEDFITITFEFFGLVYSDRAIISSQ